MKHRTAAATAAGVATLALVAAAAAPALAAGLTVVDGDDSPIDADIDTVRIAHNIERIKVRVAFDDLHRDGRVTSQGVSIFFDTDPDDRGPEYRLGGGLNSGTDYTLSAVENWSDEGDPLQYCDYIGRIRWDRDIVTYKVDPPCFGDVDEVAVAVKAGEWTEDTGNRSDWMLGKKVFSDPVPVG